MKDAPAAYSFGPFELDPVQRLLLRRGRPVPLAPKAMETLFFLVENSGRLVDKEELMKRVWPDTFVEEGNLTTNIHLLRKVLGKGSKGQEYIETIPRRGYRFTAEVKVNPTEGEGLPAKADVKPEGVIPERRELLSRVEAQAEAGVTAEVTGTSAPATEQDQRSLQDRACSKAADSGCGCRHPTVGAGDRVDPSPAAPGPGAKRG